MMSEQPDKQEIDNVINELESKGISIPHYEAEYDQLGLGDIVESTLQKFGITEERFKKWFNLNECNCSKRKAWLNKFFSIKRRRDNE